MYFAVITPGAVLEEGVIPVVDGQFSYKFDPKKMADKIRTYGEPGEWHAGDRKDSATDLLLRGDGAKWAASFFCGGDSFVRVILRGAKAIYVKDQRDLA